MLINGVYRVHAVYMLFCVGVYRSSFAVNVRQQRTTNSTRSVNTSVTAVLVLPRAASVNETRCQRLVVHSDIAFKVVIHTLTRTAGINCDALQLEAARRHAGRHASRSVPE